MKQEKLDLSMINAASLTKEQEDALFYHVDIDEQESEHLAAEPYSYWKSVLRVFSKKASARIAIVCLLLIVFSMIIVPLFAPAGAYTSNLSIKNLGPSMDHLWGTDLVGRDLFFMCFRGLSKSLTLALISSVIVVFVGTIVGLFWGYNRKIDPIMVELYNLVSNIPSLLLYMLLAFIFANAFPDMPVEVRLVISLSITGWIGVALFIRNMTLIISNREYNVASVTLGTPTFRIMMRNLLPYLLAVIITEFSLLLPGMISSEVSMSFFGVGFPSTEISIGVLLDNGRRYFTQYPWQLLAPAGVLAFIIFTFYLMGLALSDALDPKKHR